MVMGVGFRLLAMLFPAAPPGSWTAWATLALVEAGVLGLTAAFMAGAPPWPFALLLVAGLAVFFGAVLRMQFDRKPPPVKLRRPDFGVVHVVMALLCLGVTAAVGLFLAFSPEMQPGWVAAYGVLGLVGFLSQMILGVEMRLLPMFAFTEAFGRSGHAALPPSPHDMPVRPLQALSVALWAVGVPLLAWGLPRRAEEAFAELAVRGGAGALLVGTLAAAASTARVLRLAYRRPSGR
jgi:hypothetical protein